MRALGLLVRGGSILALALGLVVLAAPLLLRVPAVDGALRCAVQEAFYDQTKLAPPDEAVRVQAKAETVPVLDRCDAADDPAIWVHPTDPARSLILGTNKQRAVNVYRLDGSLASRRKLSAPNNVDLRTVDLGGRPVTIVAVSDKDTSRIELFSLDGERGVLNDLPGGPVQAEPEEETYGLCLYHSALDGTLYAVTTDKSGLIEQWRIVSAAGTEVAPQLVRRMRVATQAEACVADDANATLFVAEEAVGVWRFPAEPSKRDEPVLIARTGRGDAGGGVLVADVEGLAIHAPADRPGIGSLVVSSQGDSSYALFDRTPPHDYQGAFVLAFEGRPVGDTDGLEVTAAALGPDYPVGMLVVQDGIFDREGEPETHQNFKLVSWADVEGGVAATPREGPADP